MLRSSRTMFSLVRALMVPAATTFGVAAVATLVTACKDESQPEYWVEKLEERAWKPRAVKRLEQFFEDAFTRANKDLTSPDVTKLADQILDPLVKTYTEGYDDLDPKTRESLVKLIAAFRDKRGYPAFNKAFDEFAKKGKGGEDVKWAARAVGDMGTDEVADTMIQAFDKLEASDKEGAMAYRDLNDAMLAHPQKSWAGLLEKKLEPEIVRPTKKSEKSDIEKFRNELFWQTTAAQLLGELKDASAVEPLMKIMLDPAKADVQTTAVLALVKIGKPAVTRALKIMNDQDEAMSTFALARIQKATKAKEPPKDKPYIATAALVAGVIGHKDALKPMIEALKGAKDDSTKAVIARELAKIPATAESKQAFKDAFESISLDTIIPPGANALPVLAESVGGFYDPGMVSWLLGRAEQTKGDRDELLNLRSAATVTAIKLMKPDQESEVNGAVKKWGTKIEKDAFKQASELLKACGDRVECYLAAIEKSDNQEQKNQFVGIKAGYMIGIFGDEKARDGIIERLDAIENAAVRFTASQTIDFLSPKGSVEAADAIEKIIEKNKKSADRNKIQGDNPLKQVMYRIRSRAE
jgi:HEAT repeat protein